MSASQRRKGAGGERELCAILSDHLGEKISRRLGQARDSGHDITLPGFNVECKRRARVAGLYDWMRQCESTHDGALSIRQVPVVMVRADLNDWLVVMRLPDWIKLAREEIVDHGNHSNTDR